MTTRWRRIVLGALAVALALFVGAGSGWWAVRTPYLTPRIEAGVWTTFPRTGSTDADLYTRAHIAIWLLLGLNRSETLYFFASADDSGRPLTSACNYRISGHPPASRWWSITAYGADFFLIPNAAQRYSVGNTAVLLDASGAFSIAVSPEPQPGPWISSGTAKQLHLTLRLYNPAPELAAHPESLAAPRIVPIGACP